MCDSSEGTRTHNMKRSGQEYKKQSFKRAKSEEESRIERDDQLGSVDSKAVPNKNIHLNNRCNKLPGFGFDKQTKQFYKPNRSKNGIIRNDQKKLQKLYRRTNSQKAPMRKTANVSLQLNLPVADSSLETDTFDVEGNDEADKVNDVAKDKIAEFEISGLSTIQRQDLNKTYPTSKSNKSNLNDLDLEMDIIIPQNLKEKQLAGPPNNVPVGYRDMKPKVINEPLISLSCVSVDILVRKQTPEEQSTIQIPHIVDDKLIVDEFGTRLKTFKARSPDGHEYFRHIFYEVDKGGPADEMDIKDNYEIVLLNGKFVPDLKHSDVLDLFNEVKVDGMTRFQLVVRYVQRKDHKKAWVWIMTSAVLSPDDKTRPRGDLDYPSVEDEKIKVLPNNEYEMPPETIRFQIKNTNEFIVIGDKTIETSLTPYNILVTKRVKQDKFGNMTFKATLCGCDKKNNYVNVVGKSIVVKDDPFWFQISQISRDWAFQFDNKYVDWRTNVITSRKTGSWLTQLPQDGLDEVDAEPVPGTSHTDIPDGDGHVDFTLYDSESVESVPRLMYTSSTKGNDSASSLGDSFQHESFSDIEFAGADPHEMKQNDTQSSGYLTSGSIEEYTTNFKECPFDEKPKTPNTPMKLLTLDIGTA